MTLRSLPEGTTVQRDIVGVALTKLRAWDDDWDEVNKWRDASRVLDCMQPWPVRRYRGNFMFRSVVRLALLVGAWWAGHALMSWLT